MHMDFGARLFTHARIVIAITVTVLILLLQIEPAIADASGRAGRSGITAGRDCADCHAGGAAPTAAFSGPASVSAGATNTYTFTVTGGVASTAANGVTGFDVSVTAGTLAAVSAGTKILTSEVVQSIPTAYTAGGVTYSFDWTAPATAGAYTLYGAGLSADGDGADTGDGTATASLAVTVTDATAPPAPTAAIVVTPSTAVVGNVVDFSGAGSTPSNGATITTYDWDFGDGNIGSGLATQHTYAAASPPAGYTATLTVTDSANQSSTAQVSLVVVDAGQSGLTANAGGPYTGTDGTPVTFDASGSTAPGGAILSYTWDFGDGATSTVDTPTTTHTYALTGTRPRIFRVELTVTDNTAATATATTIAAITPPGATPPPATDPTPGRPRIGERLFVRYCEACHGPGGVGIDGDANIIGATAQAISDAIESVADMNTPELQELSETRIALISAFLRGEQLYLDHCEDCHGPAGAGIPGNAPPIIGASAADIGDAIDNVVEMQTEALQALQRRELALIAFYLPRLSRPELAADGVGIDASGTRLDAASDYPELELQKDVYARADGAGAGVLDWLSIGAAGFWMLRRPENSRLDGFAPINGRVHPAFLFMRSSNTHPTNSSRAGFVRVYCWWR